MLKLDCEGCEYDVLHSLVNTASEFEDDLLLPDQIAVEVHYSWTHRPRPKEVALWVDFLRRRGGYVIVDIHVPVKGSTNNEILFVRTSKGRTGLS